MNIYIPNQCKPQISGGFSFLRTFKKYAERAGHIVVESLDHADGMLISGVTMVDPSEVGEASRRGIPIVFRVDNVPRKSRNKRSTPHERMTVFAGLADVVVYQSEWSKNYCRPLCGDGTVIYNGVDTDIFSPVNSEKTTERWLFAYHGKNEMKSFWIAHLLFELRARENPDAEFWFVADFGSEYEALSNANFDFWNGEKYRHFFPLSSPEQMASIMRECTHYVHPAISDAAPQTVLEARACGLEIVGAASLALAGTAELLDPSLDFSADRMVSEYMALFDLVDKTSSQSV